jgi:hypothetical protein
VREFQGKSYVEGDVNSTVRLYKEESGYIIDATFDAELLPKYRSRQEGAKDRSEGQVLGNLAVAPNL